MRHDFEGRPPYVNGVIGECCSLDLTPKLLPRDPQDLVEV